ncbi:helix-turn-helix protein [Haloactinospora alba]|uniref:Helix-turn-helix protein n=1 Tax=Haloactinospora alba TaxID=405555 RepID=A0A543NEK1_9ACTN|nr:helix-turn-helix transcriptional regulator [Haloactinospora alba]TQN30229.1 helix-turn-helix protein [Haloactinospora alba]
MTSNKRTLIRYGREVQRLRHEAGLTQTALANRTQSSKSQISDVERGKGAPSASLRKSLDEYIGFGRLERLWEDLTGDGRPAWLDEIATAIQEADAVYEYQALAFPSYLQTEGYARAVIRAAAPWLSREELDTHTKERVARAQNMADTPRPMLWLALDATLLGRRYGGSETTQEQLAYIAELAKQERITVQVVPADHPRHPGNAGAFRVLMMRDTPDVAYVEDAEQGRVLTSSAAVTRRRMLFAALQGIALDPDESIKAVHEEMGNLENE